MKIKENKGITLIALVITIIVLLILAGVTINMVLGDNGIIGQAQHAKQQQENADKEQAIEIAKGEAKTSEYMGTLSTEAVSTKSGGTIINATVGVISEVKTFGAGENIKYLPIPKGLTYLEGTVEEGAVVVDGDGNEFVWVPVTTISDTELIDDAEKAEETAMQASVETYKGFYVGRYETSWTGSKVASIANVTSMTGDTMINGTKANWNMFYAKQKELSTNSVTSGMIYGGQWDAIMDWMSDVINPNAVELAPNNNFPNDSTGMGNYSGSAIATGSIPEYKVKNIYDLAGNFCEWTQEAGNPQSRVFRGGSVSNNLAIDRSYGNRASYYNNTSRLQLYIK